MTKRMMWGLWALAIVALALATACTAPAREEKAAAAAPAAAQTVEQLEAAVPDNPLKEAYFGETHVHTSFSLDAFIGGARLTPDEAYRFAQGKDVTIQGQTHNIKKPLDWAAVSDHAEFIGEMYSAQVPGAKGGDNPMLEELRGLKNVDEQRAWFMKYVINNMRGANPGHPPFYAGPETTVSAWKDIQLKAVRDNYQPGKFTTLAGFEWTASNNAGNMHRNVIFRDLTVPDAPALGARHQRRGEALGVDGGAGEEGLEAAGDSAQLQRQQGLHVRAARQRRQAPDRGVREAAQPLRALDRDDADQGQLRGAPQVLARRRVRGLRERRQRGHLQRAHVQEGELRALGRDQGARLPGEARRQPLSARLHRWHRQPQRRARGRRRGQLHRQPRSGGRHAQGSARGRDRRLDQGQGIEPGVALGGLGFQEHPCGHLGCHGRARELRDVGHAHQGALLRRG